MTKSPMLSSDSIMSNRGGLPIKNIVCAVFIVASLYLLYAYNGSLNQLHESEQTGSRYRREAEDRVSEIQELIKAKDDLQERCENDKRELSSRVKSINQQLSMLQSQHKETEADFMKLKQDMETMRSEHMQAENQHVQEYQDLKSEKERIIGSLEEEVKQTKKSNEELQGTVAFLQSQVQNGEKTPQETISFTTAVTTETVQKNLRDQNAKLHLEHYQQQQLLQQQQQQQQQQPQQQQQQQQQHQQQPQGGVLNQNQGPAGGLGQASVGLGQNFGVPNVQGEHLTGGQPQGAHLVQNMKIPNANDLSNNGLGAGNAQVQANEAALSSNHDLSAAAHYQPGENKDVNIEQLNAQHQVLPPGNDDNLVNQDKNFSDKLDDKDDLSQGERLPDENPNDLQKGQILEPKIDANNKANGGEDDLPQDSIRQAEDDRENEEMDNTFMEHKDPLALGQMQQPDELHHFEGEGEGLGQQKAPVVPNENDHNQGDKNDQQLYYQDDDVDKFLKQEDEDFDADEDRDQKSVGVDKLTGDDNKFNDGNDFARIPQLNVQPNRFNQAEDNGRWFNADDRDQDYGAAKKSVGNKF